MGTDLTGYWRSIRSNIPGYVAGGELLHFSENGNHVWEVAQPAGSGRPSVTHFILEKEEGGLRLCPIAKKSGAIGSGWPIGIEQAGGEEFVVTLQRGFVTVFRSEAGQIKQDCPF